MHRNRLISQLCLANIIQQLTTSKMTLRRWLYETLEIPMNQGEEYETNILGLLRILLLKIDVHFFSKLKPSENDGGTYEQQYDQYVSHLQRYLSKKQFKRLKNSYEVYVRQSKDDNHLLKLALYLGINSNLKKEIVDKIICLSQDEQRQLMRALKEIQRECQQVIEIKKIIERIQLLEIANQQLKAQVQQKQKGLIMQINELDEVQEENKNLSAQIEQYCYQKIHAFAQLGSVEMQDFSFSCQNIKQQIFKHTNNYEDLNCQLVKILKNNAKLKQDLKLYGKTIKQHIELLDRLKKQHMLTNQQCVLRQIPQYNNTQIITPICLSDTTNKINLSFSINHKYGKMDTDRTNCGSQQDLSFSQKQKKCSLGLLMQLSQLQKEIQQKMERVKQLKQVQQNEKNKNRKLSRKLQRMKRDHQEYTTRFMSCSSHHMELTAI